jgi:hypothetical protein
VRGNHRTTNIGYFCVGGADQSSAKLKFAQVSPSTVEQTDRFNASLGRLLIAAVTLEGIQNDQALDATLSAAACSAGHLLRAHDDSIWNSSSSVAVLSPLFQLDCARSLSHNDVCSLLCSASDARATESSFETLHSEHGSNGVVIRRRISGSGALTLACVVEVKVQARCFLRVASRVVHAFAKASLSSLRELIMDMTRRSEWVSTPSSAVLKLFERPVARAADICRPQDPIMKGEVIHDIFRDGNTQLDLVWMGSASAKGSGAFGMDLALLRCCKCIDANRIAIVSRR